MDGPVGGGAASGLAGRVKAFLTLSRIPFLTPGLAPFTAGVVLGYILGGSVDWGLLALSYAGLTLILLATHYSNEYFDYEGDVINKNHNRFSGGTRALSDGMLPRRVGLYALIASLAVFALLFAVYVARYYPERPLLAWLALAGVVAGVFYSGPPFKWAYRGVGELFIAFAYGWLAVASGYYIVKGAIDLNATLLSLPAAFTVFSLIVINEVPDYEADRAVSKRNLVVRLGRERARILYAASNIAAVVSAGVAAWHLAGPAAGLAALALSALVAYKPTADALKDSVYYDFKRGLERVSALTVLANAISSFIVLAAAIPLLR
ncbi:prenyltransferase [Stetteria hydrogenophila]